MCKKEISEVVSKRAKINVDKEAKCQPSSFVTPNQEIREGIDMKNTYNDTIELSSSRDNTILLQHKNEKSKKKEKTDVAEKDKKYEVMDTQLKQMEETVNNLQKLYSSTQPNFPINLPQPIMPFFSHVSPNFYNTYPGFTQTSPPCTTPSMHMHMSPYPPPFAAHIPSTPLTYAIMGKLKSPVAKTHRAELNKVDVNCKKANTRRPKESPGKHVAGKKLHSPNSSPIEIPISVLSKGSPTGYYINRNNLPVSNLRPNISGIEAPIKIAILWKNLPSKMMMQYQKPFMGKVEILRKVFVPVNEENVHWYLVVFHMHEGQMLWLDSKPDLRRWRRRIIIFERWLITQQEWALLSRLGYQAIQHKTRSHSGGCRKKLQED
ncbi:hypothetical protein PIB30_078299 [Stylosanthes scabra]|uniref:Ubiquitin-like protease family profile domain-containing protein n=1 Tax=Stylosanthes scabra TaxID=79078 RepID=A0ABU6XNS9_9FABA|nr:hypothetical protein [Stylosanthes scabra]